MNGIAKLANLQTKDTAAEAAKAAGILLSNADTPSLARFLVDTASVAQVTLANIDKMIEAVDSKRAALGAIQNHFPVISSTHKTSSKPDILAVLNSFERMATFRWFFCA